MIEQGDTTQTAVDTSEPSEAVKEWEKKRSTQNVVFSRFKKLKSNYTTAMHLASIVKINSVSLYVIHKYSLFLVNQLAIK